MSSSREWEIFATWPVLIVSDISRAVEFYTSIGFEEIFRNGKVYSVLRLGGHHTIHVGRLEAAAVGQSQAVIEMRDVDDYHAFCARQKAKILREPVDQFYGLRDFQVADPDGNVITFGERLESGATAPNED